MFEKLFTFAMTGAMLAMVGCGGGGEAVEDQERFQLNRSAEEGAGDLVVFEVQSLEDAEKGSIQGAASSVAESLEGANMDNFSEENKKIVEQIKSLVGEIAANGDSSGEKVQQVLDMAAKLPTSKGAEGTTE